MKRFLLMTCSVIIMLSVSTITTTVIYAQTTYSIVVSSGVGGSISPDGIVYIEEGSDQQFTITPNSGYIIENVVVDGMDAGSVSSYLFPNVSSDHTIEASFTLNNTSITYYSLVTGVEPNNSGQTTGAGHYTSGTIVTITAVPIEGYIFNGWIGDVNDSASSNTTVVMDSDKLVTAVFFKPDVQATYSIVVSSGVGGSISPGGIVYVAEGSDQQFTITPNSGYTIANVVVDGMDAGSVSSYLFPNVSSDHTIEASFTLNNTSITYYSLVTGVEPNNSGQTTGTGRYSPGTDVSITAVPNDGYVFDSWIGDVDDPASAKTIISMDSDKSVTAVFKKNVIYNLRLQVDPENGGVTSPSKEISHQFNESSIVQIEAVPAPGYAFDRWSDNVEDMNSGVTTITMDSNKEVRAYFTEIELLKNSKAILVAGSGPYASNTVWTAIEMNANYAYKILKYQGYSKNTIYYLSAGSDMDLDADNIADDIDDQATMQNLKYALSTWAAGSDDLLLYMVGHGSDGAFQLNASENLPATELNAWLNEAQNEINDHLIIIYDACSSGNFLPKLRNSSSKKRLIITSTSENEDSLLVDDGTLSFSFIFFSKIFHGDKLYDAFVHARNSIEYAYDYRQIPQIEGNNDGIGNQEIDKEVARGVKLGKEIKSYGSIPTIGEIISLDQPLVNENKLLIYAEGVNDPSGIQRVWAVITPPDYTVTDPGNPVIDLPVVELLPVGNKRYEAFYDRFIATGTYHISIFAMDEQGDISLPEQTSIEKVFAEPDQPPVAGFGSDLTNGNAPLMVQFTDQSTGYVVSYLWDFGDGNTSIKQNPKYTYHKAGTYQVSLTVEGPAEQDAEIKPGYITVPSPGVPASPPLVSGLLSYQLYVLSASCGLL